MVLPLRLIVLDCCVFGWLFLGWLFWGWLLFFPLPLPLPFFCVTCAPGGVGGLELNMSSEFSGSLTCGIGVRSRSCWSRVDDTVTVPWPCVGMPEGSVEVLSDGITMPGLT
jgi:hypothetical protein